MTNARKIKEAIKQDVDSMTTEQLFAFCNLFEDARQYGIFLRIFCAFPRNIVLHYLLYSCLFL